MRFRLNWLTWLNWLNRMAIKKHNQLVDPWVEFESNMTLCVCLSGHPSYLCKPIARDQVGMATTDRAFVKIIIFTAQDVHVLVYRNRIGIEKWLAQINASRYCDFVWLFRRASKSPTWEKRYQVVFFKVVHFLGGNILGNVSILETIWPETFWAETFWLETFCPMLPFLETLWPEPFWAETFWADT